MLALQDNLIFELIEISIKVNGIAINTFIDIGSTISVFSASTALKLSLQTVHNSTINLTQVNGTTQSLDRTNVTMTIANGTSVITLHVLEHFQYPLLLNLNAREKFCLRLDLSNRSLYVFPDNSTVIYRIVSQPDTIETTRRYSPRRTCLVAIEEYLK